MKPLTVLLAVAIWITAGCNKNNPNAHTAAPPNNQNNTQSQPTATLSQQEQMMVGTWYYQKSETVYNGSITSIAVTYSGNPAFNTVTFTSSLSPISVDTIHQHYPNFKVYNVVQNGNTVNGLCWKITNLGNLLLGFDQVSTTLIDSLTATRFVYTTGDSYPIVSGMRYTLHK